MSISPAPARLDLIQLGLGDDGHTASLVPDDPVLEATTDVAVSAGYKGTRRWTMTAPLINRARERLFLVTGTEKDGRSDNWHRRPQYSRVPDHR